METVQGQALVASPYLTDSNFMRSVVYILRHDQEGAVGLVLNRPTDTTVGSLLGQLLERPIDNELPVYCGGPVEGPLMLLQEMASDELHTRSVYVASDQERILKICDESDVSQRYRVFDGYSGWGPGQLDNELRSGGWLVFDIQPDQLFSPTDDLWQQAVKQIGREILSGGIDPSKMPEDPAYN
jgi:putative transcriptional regulator